MHLNCQYFWNWTNANPVKILAGLPLIIPPVMRKCSINVYDLVLYIRQFCIKHATFHIVNRLVWVIFGNVPILGWVMDSKVGLYYTKHYAHGGLKSKKRVQSKRREDLSNHTIQFFLKWWFYEEIIQNHYLNIRRTSTNSTYYYCAISYMC